MVDEHGRFPKVAAYVTCERAGRPHLLLFRHPLAGVQLPAGSIEAGEDPAAAAVREVAEETGLHDVTDPGSLGVVTSHLPPGLRVMLRNQIPRRLPGSGELQGTAPIKRGLTVELIELVADNAHVRVDVLDYGSTPPAVISRREGWVDAAALGTTVVRHHIHLRHSGEGADQWTQMADGHVFEPFWGPLVPRPDVCPAQSEWLDFAYLRLLDRAQ